MCLLINLFFICLYCLPIFFFICSFVYLFVRFFTVLFIDMFACLFDFFVFMSLSIYLFMCLFTCWFDRLNVYLLFVQTGACINSRLVSLSLNDLFISCSVARVHCLAESRVSVTMKDVVCFKFFFGFIHQTSVFMRMVLTSKHDFLCFHFILKL